MKLWNKTQDKPAVDELELASSFGKRFLGLMGRRSLPQNAGLLLMRSNSIHMCFMRFPIDAVFLDADMRVVQVAPELKIWRLAGCRKASHTLELPAGCVSSAGIEIGDELAIVDTGTDTNTQ